MVFKILAIVKGGRSIYGINKAQRYNKQFGTAYIYINV